MGFNEGIQNLAQAVTVSLGGESVVYTPKGGSPATFNAVVERKPVEDLDGEGNRVTRRMADVHAPVASVPTYIQGSSIVAGGQRYTVTREIYRDSAMVGLSCEAEEIRQQAARRTRENAAR